VNKLRVVSGNKSSLKRPFFYLCAKIIALWFICGGLWGIAWGKSPHWWRPGFIVDSFLEIALKNEHSQRKGEIRKWTSGIRYVFDHRVGDEAFHEQMVVMHLRQLAEITGIPIQPATSMPEVNLQIVFSTEQRLAVELKKDFHFGGQETDYMLRHSVCLGQFSTTAQGAIRQAIVIIPVDRARASGKLVSCVVEELTQVMGLPNDSASVYPSIFNDQSIYILLTGLDYVLLKTLYDPRLTPGMTSQQAAPVVRKIVDDFHRQHLIERAEQLVGSGELYSLLY